MQLHPGDSGIDLADVGHRIEASDRYRSVGVSSLGHAVEMDVPRRRLITVSVMLSSLLPSLDQTIANVALPHIQGSLAATQDQMAWVLTSYIVAAAITIPLSGWLAGRLGRKRIFMISIVGFTVASMLCGAAQSLAQIVLARILQGMCGAALVPLSQAVLLDINPPANQPRAMAIWGMGTIIGPIVGPVLGGWLTENYNWRWVFYINVPFGTLALLGVLSFLPETATRKSRFDFLGFSALSIGIGALQMMLDRGQQKDWFNSMEICIEGVVAATAFYLFIVHMLTTTHQRFVSPALFRDRNYLTCNVLLFITVGVLFGNLALLPTMLQQLLNYPVVTAGFVTAPRGVGTLISMIIAGRIVGKVDLRLLVSSGFALTAFSLWQMTGFDLQMDTTLIVWSGVLQGLGSGLIFAPLSAAAFATLASTLRNEGTAIFSLTRNFGGSIGISVAETLLTRNTQIMHASLGEHLNRYSSILRAQLPGGSASLHTLAGLNATMTQQAAMIAYNNNFKLMMLLCLATMPLVFMLRNGGIRAAESVAIE
jgi:DHA2 family multidrug resistance protein